MVNGEKIANWVGCVSLLAAVWAVFYTHSQMSELAFELSKRQAAERTRGLRLLTQQKIEKKGAVRPSSGASAPGKIGSIAPSTKKGVVVGPGGILIRAESLFGKYSSLRTSFMDAVPSRVASLYGHFFAIENLSESEVAEFTRAIVGRERAWMELQCVAYSESNPKTDETDELYQEAVRTCDRALKALLGEERFGRLEEYRQTINARETLKPLLVLSGENERLPEVVLSELARAATVLAVFGGPSVSVQAFREFREQASGLLTLGQMEVLDMLLDKYQVEGARPR